NTAMVMPLGQGAGALLLVMLKGVALPWFLPALGVLITVAYIFYSYKQNKAYGEALLDMLKEDRIHLPDLEDDDIRQLDSAAVAAISERLKSDQDEVTLAVIELLRTIGSAQARTALLQHVPFPSPRATATALQALAAIGGEDTDTCLRPYLEAPEPQVRMAALAGLLQLGDATVRQHAVRLLDDPDVEVRAAALRVVLADPQSPDYARAYQSWEAMLDTPDAATQVAALSIMAEVPETPLQGRVYRALDHAAVEVRHAALRELGQLATAGRVTSLDSALLRTLESHDAESRDL